MIPDQLASDLSLAAFAFGALAFCVLACAYWLHKPRLADPPVAAFTTAAGVAFAANLALVFGAPGLAAILLVRALAAGLLVPIALHLVLGGSWSRLLGALYLIALIVAGARGLNDTGILPNAITEITPLPALLLAASSAAGLFHALRSPRTAQRRWNIALLAALALTAVLDIALPGITEGLPDYLLVALFCSTLCYRHRLLFFDFLVKQAAWLAIGGALLSTVFIVAGWTPWTRAWLLTPLWLAAPPLFSRLNRMIDRSWLGRRCSAAEAEHMFLREVLAATGESDLRERSTRVLGEIFRAPAAFDGSGDSLRAQLPAGDIVSVAMRPDGVPHLGDDHRLFHALSSILGVVLENTRYREREQELRLLAGRAELKALRAQINPHFLFNALNSIAGLIPDHPELADRTLEQLASVFRYTLRTSNAEWLPLSDEIEFLTAYLEVEQARFGDRLEVDLQVAPAAAACTIPAMCIQPLVENAIRHGASKLEAAGRVRLRVSHEEHVLNIEVADNGPGFPDGFTIDAADPAHGLGNVAQRLRGHFGSAAAISIVRDGETRVRLTLPGERV